MGRAEDTTIYLIGPADRSRVKIGISKDPERRLRQLQTASAERLMILDLVPGGTFLERHLQYSVQNFHLGGEWFWGGEEFSLTLKIAFQAFLHAMELREKGEKVIMSTETWSCRKSTHARRS